MKLLFILSICMFIRLPQAAAYLEISNEGEAQMTAGDQNTNLYKLNSTTMLRIKKMRKIDNALAKNPEYADSVASEMIEEILNDNAQQEQDTKEELKKQLQDTVSRTQDKMALIIKDTDKFAQFQIASASAVRDKAVVAGLRQKLRRK